MSEFFWILLGLASEGCFFLRMVLQWIVSEKTGKSIVPPVFWYLSIVGAIGLLAYSLYRQDIVFVLSSGIGLFFYYRNVHLIRKKKSEIK